MDIKELKDGILREIERILNDKAGLTGVSGWEAELNRSNAILNLCNSYTVLTNEEVKDE